jgi:hypothetical protein
LKRASTIAVDNTIGGESTRTSTTLSDTEVSGKTGEAGDVTVGAASCSTEVGASTGGSGGTGTAIGYTKGRVEVAARVTVESTSGQNATGVRGDDADRVQAAEGDGAGLAVRPARVPTPVMLV